VHARITKSSLWAATRTLVFCDNISLRLVRGFLLNEGFKEGCSLKVVILPLFGSSSVKTVANGHSLADFLTSTADELLKSTKMDDLEQPSNLKKLVFSDFLFLVILSCFQAVTYSSTVNCVDITRDRLKFMA